MRATTLELPKGSRSLASGFAQSLDTWRGQSAFDACPDLLMDADWAALASSIVTRWSIDADECPPMRFLASVPSWLARSLEQNGNDHCTAVFDFLVADGMPKIRPRDPQSLLKPEVHLWANYVALERLRGWRREGMWPDQEQVLTAAARKIAQQTSRAMFKVERLSTCRRDERARELARYLSPALFGFLLCTRGDGYPLSGRRSVPHEWLQTMRLQARDVGLLLRLAPRYWLSISSSWKALPPRNTLKGLSHERSGSTEVPLRTCRRGGSVRVRGVAARCSQDRAIGPRLRGPARAGEG
jgi:hypothetical protein